MARLRCGFVAVVGRPNSGKSTLVNRLVGERVTIVSPMPQTTRYGVKGVVNLPDAQVVLLDTPGLHKPRDPLGELLNKRVREALGDADLVWHLVDASVPIGSGDLFTHEAIRSAAASTERVLVLTKVDLVSGGGPAALAAADEAGLTDYAARLPVSAVTDEGLAELVAEAVSRLPQGPRYFPEGMTTDQPHDRRIAELIRQEVLVRVREEVPHAVAVEVSEVGRRKGSDLADVFADIVVERESQKGILVGKGGRMLKEIGTAARASIEELVGGRVNLQLRVRCRAHWRDDISLLRRFGYADRRGG